MLTILIYEPDKHHALELRNMVKEFFLSRRCEVQLTTHSLAESVLEKLKNNPHQYNILLLSVATPSVACKMAEIVRKENLLSSLLFFAADYKALLKTLVYRPSAYFVLPIEPKRLHAALLRAQEEQSRDVRYFFVSNRNGFIRIPYETIEYFQSDQRNVTMFVKGKEEGYHFQAKLDAICDHLPSELFLRCHQSYCINSQHIAGVDKSKKCIVLFSGMNIPISKRNYASVVDICHQRMV